MKRDISGNLIITDSPFILDALTKLRDKATDIENFRYFSNHIFSILLANCLKSSDLTPANVSTPIGNTEGMKIQGDFVVVAILRSGIAMIQPALSILPYAKVGIAGIFRDEKTSLPHEYYWKMPKISKDTTVIITDPMLATGGSVLHTIRKIKMNKPKEIRVVSLVAAPEGVLAVHSAFPEITIYIGSLDQKLNDFNYIIPGLGDFGDRYFGTK